jgi:hypothetical protein
MNTLLKIPLFYLDFRSFVGATFTVALAAKL